MGGVAANAIFIFDSKAIYLSHTCQLCQTHYKPSSWKPPKMKENVQIYWEFHNHLHPIKTLVVVGVAFSFSSLEIERVRSYFSSILRLLILILKRIKYFCRVHEIFWNKSSIFIPLWELCSDSHSRRNQLFIPRWYDSWSPSFHLSTTYSPTFLLNSSLINAP